MIKMVAALVVGICAFSAVAHADVTSNQLGQMLLGSGYTKISQEYLAYYAKGPISETKYGGYHPGIDYSASKPLPVYSPISGVVTAVGGPYGTLAIKKDGSDTRLLILHMSKINVRVGAKVQVGCALGLTGAVGTATPHLHVEARSGKDNAAWYFPTNNNAGVNKNPVLLPQSFKAVNQSIACK